MVGSDYKVKICRFWKGLDRTEELTKGLRNGSDRKGLVRAEDGV